MGDFDNTAIAALEDDDNDDNDILKTNVTNIVPSESSKMEVKEELPKKRLIEELS